MADPNVPNDWFSANERKWEMQFAKLVAFKERFGHCHVSKRWKEDPRLAIWVANQRQAYWQNTLKLDRGRQLVEIDFIGRDGPNSNISWEDRFAQLVVFKARFGHCDVHCHWPEDPSFGYWVSNQRQFHKKGLLKPEYIRRLEELGFIWKSVLHKSHPHRVYRKVFRPIPPELEALDNLWNKRLAALRNGV